MNDSVLDTILDHWTIAIFLPAILVGLAVLVVIVRYKNRD